MSDFETLYKEKVLSSCDKIDIGTNESYVEIKVEDVFVEPKIKILSSNINLFAKNMDERIMPFHAFFSQNNKIIITGGPGSGKSILIKYLTIVSINDKAEAEKYGIKEGTIFITVSIPAYLTQNISLREFICRNLKKEYLDDVNPEECFLQRAKEGKVVFVFEGIDDVSKGKWNSLFADINDFSKRIGKNNKYIISARSFYFQNSFFDFKIAYIQNFDLDDVEIYAKSILRVLGLDDRQAHEGALKFKNLVSKNSNLINLTENPLFLSIMVILFSRNRELPNKRIELYSIYLSDLIDSSKCLTKDSGQNNDGMSRDNIIKILSYVSYCIIKNNINDSLISESLLKNYIKKFYEKKANYSNWEATKLMQLFFDSVIKHLGLFEKVSGNNAYVFAQSSLKEYLAALHICFDLEDFANRGQNGRIRYKEILDMLLVDNKWAEVIRLVMEYVLTINPDICDPVSIVYHLLESTGKSNIKTILAGEGLQEMEVLDSSTYNNALNLCKKKLLEILDHQKTPELSIKAAKILANLGDPRFEDYYLIPEMVSIPRGHFIKGSKSDMLDDLIKQANEVELNENDLWMRKYWTEILKSEAYVGANVNCTIKKDFNISKYPITNAQYEQFLKDNPNYPIPGKAMDNKGIIYTWDELTRTCNKSYCNNPVVLVSWYDASAYCKWLSDKTGRKFRLPTEEEWEYAARGPENLVYPWGNEWHDNYCNTVETGYNGIVPVGSLRIGESKFGVSDCSGQIWEWTSTADFDLWNRAWPKQLEDEKTTEAYIVKGGAWDDIAVFARCASRGPNAPTYYEHYIGFRIVEDL